ncbi:MAG TPA: DUF3267 domain-containing protein [Lentibacillus sp.]|uniref:DUF3267 domain-containing protein n=1 Tax=Lentibacillus sp. TaxID=1925746 RepID=UPI002B4B1118|nr:DUF3267 domain-containing protein [Lentibacillus sp.]HLR62125.1 DUF3267 domain-containing protein [Lentibacillus sp.]
MSCWKIINFNKEYGINRLYLQSFLIGLLAFIFLYVPFSIKHGTISMNESGILPLIIMVCCLPVIHSLMHILPLIMMNKRARLIYKRNTILFPIINYYTKKQLTKKASLLAAVAPTILITIPGMTAAYLFSEFYVYFLIFTAAHIAMTYTDFLYISSIAKAPKQSFVENRNNEITILVKNETKSAG